MCDPDYGFVGFKHQSAGMLLMDKFILAVISETTKRGRRNPVGRQRRWSIE